MFNIYKQVYKMKQKHINIYNYKLNTDQWWSYRM